MTANICHKIAYCSRILVRFFLFVLWSIIVIEPIITIMGFLNICVFGNWYFVLAAYFKLKFYLHKTNLAIWIYITTWAVLAISIAFWAWHIYSHWLHISLKHIFRISWWFKTSYPSRIWTFGVSCSKASLCCVYSQIKILDSKKGSWGDFTILNWNAW